MKKIDKSPVPPKGLSDYIKAHPEEDPKHTWETFSRENSHARRAVKKQIYCDQRGLCAYCEIDLIDPSLEKEGEQSRSNLDFQVEHFHPKSDHSDPHKNWELEWDNLLGCCKGGDDPNSERFSDKKSGRHCGCRKGNRKLDGDILNPLHDIPAFPCLWKTDGNPAKGQIRLDADEKACSSVSKTCCEKAQNTLKELNLNSNLLTKFRSEAIKVLFKEMQNYIKKEGLSSDQAIDRVMEAAFNPAVPAWPPFFSTIRAFFGIAAEKRLKVIGYGQPVAPPPLSAANE